MSIILTILKIILYVILAVIGLVLVLSIFPVSAKILFRAGKLTVDAKYTFLKYRIYPLKEGKKAETVDEPEQVSAPDNAASEENSPETESENIRPEVASSAVQEPAVEEVKPDEPQQEEADYTEEQMETAVSAEEDEPESSDDDDEEHWLVAMWNKVRPFIDPSSKTLVALFRHIHMDDVEIVWNVRSDDAARVGMLSGLAWMVIGEVMKTLGLLFGKHLTYKELTVMPCFDPKDGADERFGCVVAIRPIIILLIAIYFLIEFLKEKISEKRSSR
ncbi:MAG: hypothetical protein Q4D71_11370 [Oscillospiraceae bacterium]|nr:hypothetical protein [Oscillospiraceae bacterium]